MSAIHPKADIDAELLVDLICIAGRKRQEADMIAAPTWMLEGGTFAPAISAARASTQFVTTDIRPPPDDGHGASKWRMMLAALAPQPHPRCRSL